MGTKPITRIKGVNPFKVGDVVTWKSSGFKGTVTRVVNDHLLIVQNSLGKRHRTEVKELRRRYFKRPS